MRPSLFAALALFAVGHAGALTMTHPNSTTVIHERAADWAAGTRQGVQVTGNSLEVMAGQSSGSYTSPVLKVPTFTELIPSWNAQTPGQGSVTVEVRVPEVSARWFSFGTWRAGAERASVNGQREAGAQVLTDVLRLARGAQGYPSGYQYRLTLRGAGTRVRLLAFNTSDRTRPVAVGAKSDRRAWGRVLDVPARSQMLYPGGGENWCSPTSVSMILAFHGVNVSVPDAARGTHDRVHEGTGNWPFNAAYAGTLGLRAFVTRLPSLAAAEAYVNAGVPLALSLAWEKGELPGVPLASSSGHLMVLVGFDAAGNPILNDPAAPTDAGVRRTYPRAAFERLWLTHSGGLTYVIAPPGHALP